MKKTIVFCYLLLVAACILYSGDARATLESFEGRSDIIGQRTDLMDQISLTRAFPNIVPLRKQVRAWIVKVPLVPFIAPTLILPPLEDGKHLPRFLMYKLKYLTPVRNQGDCGSCFLFSVCDMLSDRAMISSGGLFNKNLSVQQLLECVARDGCDGGSPEDITLELEKSGKRVVTESAVPYKQGGGGAVSLECPSAANNDYQVGIVPKSIVSIVDFIQEVGYDKTILQKNIHNMKMALYTSGACYCAMTVYDDFFGYTGLKPYKPRKNASPIGGHAVNIIGYCEKGEDTRPDFKDVGYWICRNSWGDGWPLESSLSGYFTIVMGSNVCGIESRVGGATPEIYGPALTGGVKSIEELRYTDFKIYSTS